MSNVEFVHYFSRFEALLYSFAFRLTKNEEEAQDLVQETAYKAFKYRNLYQPHTNLRAWLMTIMRNTFINDYRKQKRRQTLNDQTSNDYFINSGSQMARNNGESDVTIEELQAIVNELEDWTRIPFLMHYQGFKYEEIADELNIPLGTVKSRIFFARKQLKARIQKLYHTEMLEELLY